GTQVVKVANNLSNGPDRGAVRQTQTMSAPAKPAPSIASKNQVKAVVKPGPVIRVPAGAQIAVTRSFPRDKVSGDVFGVAIHLTGSGARTGTRASASAYFEVKFATAMLHKIKHPAQIASLNFAATQLSNNGKYVNHDDLLRLLPVEDAHTMSVHGLG